MEEKELNAKESLELITRMIQNSKKNLQIGSGNILLLWGYLCAITAVVIYILTKTTGNPAWNWLWFSIPTIGYPVMYRQIKKEKTKPILTYTDKVLKTIWKVIGQYGIFISIMCCLYFEILPFLLPIILILTSLGMCITGSIINDKYMYNSSGCGIGCGIITLSHIINSPQIDLQYLAFAFCFIVMMVIPGHRLNKEAKRLCSKN